MEQADRQPTDPDLAALAEALDRLAAADPGSLADPESVQALHRALSALDAVTTRAVAAFDAGGGWAATGARTAADWLATRTRAPKKECRRRVALGRTLAHLPAFGAAWAAGDICAAHVRTVAAVRRDATKDALARDEKLLLDQALALRYEPYRRGVAYWEQLADPDGTDDDAERRRNRRDVWLTQSFAGMWFGRITLDPISGQIVATQHERIETELFHADWAEAKARLGRDPAVTELARTPAQRRADALVEMATRAGTAPADGRRPAPLFTVLIDWPTISGRVCELASGAPLTPGSLLPWLTAAYLERAVWRPPNRVEVSRTARLYTGATRRAVQLRDRTCYHPYCDQPAEDCQTDHIHPWAHGGETTQTNGRPGCGHHNRLRETRQHRRPRRRRGPPGADPTPPPDDPDPPAAA